MIRSPRVSDVADPCSEATIERRKRPGPGLRARKRTRPAAAWLAALLPAPALLAGAGGEPVPVATGVHYESRGADGARISTRLERLAARDWEVGPLAVRPFARALVEGGRVEVHRPAGALPESRPPESPAPGPDRASPTEALHRLAQGLAGRELVEFRIRRFAFAAFRGDDRELLIEAREADVQRHVEALELREVRAATGSRQRLEAERVRLRWDPERLEIRGRYLWCDADHCRRGERLDLGFEPSSGRLVPALGTAGERAQH